MMVGRNRVSLQRPCGQGEREHGPPLCTLQRYSVRVVLVVALLLNQKIFFRYVRHAYSQSHFKLVRSVLLVVPTEVCKAMNWSLNTILRAIGPLYGITESGDLWNITYSRYHKDRDDAVLSGYKPLV
eukprot:Plantae.Rhodophyta-Rhodochaete_pulchella.ctg2016.p1 GENE.Plantae.Rhodophyta-Rhodochaete_pulchella.ctg2016~~Plantae.Rhodophyta-Rhodochaete_pulchella.ctg2016.p1  ORF type:complete len:127 (+),score=7.26 Plantae.Rhodophyta-Rhodochaete_pulchella.ctg2016:249-629(+)